MQSYYEYRWLNLFNGIRMLDGEYEYRAEI